LGQPLGAILNYAEAAMIYLKQSPPNLAKVEEILANIQRDDLRAANIISHLRGLLRKKHEIEVQEFDLSVIINDTMQIVGAEAIRNGVELEPYRPNGAMPVRADRVQVQQVLVNLAMNGIDAMRGNSSGERKMAINTALANGSVEVTIADTGTGVPPDKLNKVFDAFYTTKGNGTGLGLSIARTIVQTFGGTIWAENRPGGGAIFRFRLPLLKTI
jgi:signal transduction histidine kinase